MIPDAVSAENVNEMYGNSNSVKPSSAGSESGKDGIERPKLNLKPRSQPVEHSEGNTRRDRLVTRTAIFYDVLLYLRLLHPIHFKDEY